VNANASQTDIYVFGGMCPTSGANTSTWQSDASYSNHMLKLTPESSGYMLDLSFSRGPPIAEAGFTITGLAPTTSNSSGILTQEQNFVLLGGHTQLAFINMSQVAIWTLPQESWSFITVDSPSSPNPKTELAIKSTTTSVDSRSGHTAVLTEDGSKIIVLGGWVGDITQAADPQLAVLDLGTGFGGTGDWVWSIPTQQPSGNGMYGHGAVMLPGNIMMVLGGYNISSSSNSKRQAASGTNAMFFNATSSTWISDYSNPSYVAALANNEGSSSSSNSNKLKIGLGVGLGLGLGLLAILIAVGIYFCYSKQLKKRREDEREKHIQSLSVGASTFYNHPREMGQTGGTWTSVWSGREDQDPSSAVVGYENLQSGVHGLGDNGYPAPPRQIPRKPLHSRNAKGLYQPTPTYDMAAAHGRANSLGTAGPIHPIYEADEEDQMSQISDIGVGVALGDPSIATSSARPENRYSDPFRDPPTTNFSAPLRTESRISTVSTDAESSAVSREREIQEWVSDWAAADALLNTQARFHSSAGRVSPTRRAQLIAAQTTVSSVSGEEDSGRTASNLSEQSVAVSVLTVSRSGSSSQGRSRSNSLRGFITNAMNPFNSTLLSTTVGSTTVSPVFDGPGARPPPSAGSGSSSFTTAHTSFPALQAEAENLLPRPTDEAMYYAHQSGEVSPARSSPDSGSPSKSKTSTLGKGRTGWLGSIRKVFAGESTSRNVTPEPTFSSRTPSPIRIGQDSGAQPRRTVSAGATLWRRKQGRGDWQDSADLGTPSPGPERSNTFTGSPVGIAGAGDDEEWDIEQAVQNRVVQVMFTVPKEKLRVVNHDVGGSETSSLRSKKGSNKSMRTIEEDRTALPPIPGTVDEDGGGIGMDKGKGREIEIEESPGREEKKRGRVAEIVEKIEEGRASPSPSPLRF
jgi:preprotein translocase subunit YajC